MSQTTTTTVTTNNVVDYYTNTEGDLFLKYFLIDSSFNSRGWAVDRSIIEKLAKRSIGAPFTDYEDYPITRYRDQHPWHMSDNATFKDHYDYARSKQTGYAVDVSPTSQNALKSASGKEIKEDGYFVTIKITDPVKKSLYLQNPERIPKISTGVFDYDKLDLVKGQTVIKNADIVHFAGVQKGAYGDKARVYASCSGGYECVNHLKGASDLDPTDFITKIEMPLPQPNILTDTYGKTGEVWTQEVSSLGENSTQNKDIMSDQQNPLSTVQSENSNNDLPTQPNQTQEQESNKPAQQLLDAKVTTNANEETQIKEEKLQNNDNKGSPFRLKTQKFDFQKNLQKETEQANKVPDWKQDPEYVKLLKEHEELKKKSDFEDAKRKYAELIPRELFFLNGKFDTIGYNKELEKAVNKNLDPDYAKELYELKLKNIKLGSKIGKPFGASANNVSNTQNKEYKTPDTVPDSNENLKGASDINSSQFAGVHNLFKMVGLVQSQSKIKEVSA